jgi:hypothetical protein
MGYFKAVYRILSFLKKPEQNDEFGHAANAAFFYVQKRGGGEPWT